MPSPSFQNVSHFNDQFTQGAAVAEQISHLAYVNAPMVSRIRNYSEEVANNMSAANRAEA